MDLFSQTLPGLSDFVVVGVGFGKKSPKNLPISVPTSELGVGEYGERFISAKKHETSSYALTFRPNP